MVGQVTWSGPSDYDRLQAAFDELEADRVVARMNFTCCNTCGTDEIDDERTPLDDAGDAYGFREWQYTFFHSQDADRLAETPGVLYLTYSAWRPSPDLDPALIAAARGGDAEARVQVYQGTDACVGERVAAALRHHGLTVLWEGDPAERIGVSITDWRKPLPV